MASVTGTNTSQPPAGGLGSGTDSTTGDSCQSMELFKTCQGVSYKILKLLEPIKVSFIGRRSSLDESPCSSIGRHYSSTPTSSSPRQHRNGDNVYGSTPSPLVPAQTRPVDNVYGVSPLQSPLVSPQHKPKQYSKQQPVYEVPVNSLPRFLQTPPGHNDRPSRLSMDQRQSNVPRLYQDSMPSMYGHNISPIKLNQTMFV